MLLLLMVAEDVPRLRVRRMSGAFSLSELLRLVLLLSVSSASEWSGLVYSGGGRLSWSCSPSPTAAGWWWSCAWS